MARLPKRSPKSQALRDAIRAVADENLGFIYTDDESLRKNINTEYQESADLSLLDRSTISEEDVEEELESMDEALSQREKVYFINPFERPRWNEEPLLNQLEQAFTKSPFLTSEQLREEIEKLDLEIAIRESEPIFQALIDEGYLEHGLNSTGNTAYYKAGAGLRDHRLIDLKPLSKRLESKSTEGIITRSELERVLNIPIDDRIINELKRKDAIRQLSDAEFLVDEPASRKTHVEAQVDDRFIRAVEQAFREENYLLPEGDYREVLREELASRSKILDTDLNSGTESSLLDVLDRRLREYSSMNIEEIGPHANDYDLDNEHTFLRLTGESRQFIVRKAEEYIVEEADGQSLPADERHFIQNVVLPAVDADEFTDSTNQKVRNFYQQLVESECQSIAQNGRLGEVLRG